MRLRKPTANQLMLAISNKMHNEGHDSRVVSKLLGVSYSYLMSLHAGSRPVEKAKREFLVKAAGYIGVPVAQAYLLAGAIKPADLTVMAKDIRRANGSLEQLQRDPEWAGYMPSQQIMKGASDELRLLLGMMYKKLQQA